MARYHAPTGQSILDPATYGKEGGIVILAWASHILLLDLGVGNQHPIAQLQCSTMGWDGCNHQLPLCLQYRGLSLVLMWTVLWVACVILFFWPGLAILLSFTVHCKHPIPPPAHSLSIAVSLHPKSRRALIFRNRLSSHWRNTESLIILFIVAGLNITK